MTVTVKILRNDRHTPPSKLADAELHFSGEPMDGLKLIGFAIWKRRDGNGCAVTFPARTFNVHGGNTNVPLLRAISDPKSQDHVREVILRAYAEHQQHLAELAS
jgi:hypothetical protein